MFTLHFSVGAHTSVSLQRREQLDRVCYFHSNYDRSNMLATKARGMHIFPSDGCWPGAHLAVNLSQQLQE